MVDDKPKMARSYRSNIIDDNAVISINLKWLFQITVLIGGIVYGYWTMENRISTLEKELEEADAQIKELVNKHIEVENQKLVALEEQLKWYETELNLNPLSWKKKRKK